MVMYPWVDFKKIPYTPYTYKGLQLLHWHHYNVLPFLINSSRVGELSKRYCKVIIKTVDETVVLHHSQLSACVCVCVCVCVCSLLLGNPNFKDPYLLAQVV